MNYSEVESKVREATNDESWGPSGSLMGEIAKYTYTYEHHPEVMSMLWRRMFESKKNWRRTYKSLLLLSYLINNGSERVVTNAREHIYDMKPLEDYIYRDAVGKDLGINIRQKSKEIIAFLQDDERLREARKNARKTRDKYVGISSEETQNQYSDRYDPTPRSRSKFYGEYKDNEEEEETTSRPYHDDDRSSPERNEPEIGDDITTAAINEERKKPAGGAGQPSKLVDLGAAANFGTTSNTTSATVKSAQSTTGNLDDMFGDFSGPPETQPSLISGKNKLTL
jgi:telomere length regulation protein